LTNPQQSHFCLVAVRSIDGGSCGAQPLVFTIEHSTSLLRLLLIPIFPGLYGPESQCGRANRPNPSPRTIPRRPIILGLLCRRALTKENQMVEKTEVTS
uniref:Secreted protein n=1 Tax=Taenia asiatica TaxID=60517 RepID=A0A0R3W9R5_TAEAS